MAELIPTRAAALTRLEAFVPHAGHHYARKRNFDLGPGRHEHVSALSPYIRHRLISEEEVVAAVLERHSYSAAETFIQEICWRSYWKGWLERRPAIWRRYRRQVRSDLGALENNNSLNELWDAAVNARTGIACFDAWSTELIETGYLHNHARMWFASIWIYTLRLPWALGADFFLRHLLDGDPASNTLSWRWVCGLQTRGKTYLARPANIARFTDGRFHPGDKLAGTAPPLEEPPPPEPRPAPRGETLPDAPYAWLHTEEDLSFDLSANDSRLRGVGMLSGTDSRSPLPVAHQVLDFVNCAMDGRQESLNCPVRDFRTDSDAIDAVVDWARELRVSYVVTPFVPQGPTAELINKLRHALARHELKLIRPMRAWDAAAWPHASGGFFRFRKHIPALLRTTGVLPAARRAS